MRLEHVFMLPLISTQHFCKTCNSYMGKSDIPYDFRRSFLHNEIWPLLSTLYAVAQPDICNGWHAFRGTPNFSSPPPPISIFSSDFRQFILQI